jgi:hypothetical protein
MPRRSSNERQAWGSRAMSSATCARTSAPNSETALAMTASTATVAEASAQPSDNGVLRAMGSATIRSRIARESMRNFKPRAPESFKCQGAN